MKNKINLSSTSAKKEEMFIVSLPTPCNLWQVSEMMRWADKDGDGKVRQTEITFNQGKPK